MCQSEVPDSNNNSITEDLEKLSVADKTGDVQPATDNITSNVSDNTKDLKVKPSDDSSSSKKDDRTGEDVEEKTEP